VSVHAIEIGQFEHDAGAGGERSRSTIARGGNGLLDPRRCAVLDRGSPDYERVRQSLAWNARIPDRFPDVIAQPRDVDDVVAFVNAARERKLRIAVRSGGHSWSGAFVRAGGMLLDMGAFNQVDVSPAGARASAGPAVKSRELMASLLPYGRGFPAGHCPTVGLGGFLLAGGRGWNWSEWGPACYSVDGVDLVLYDGRQVHADAEHHADLLWAARGGGVAFPAIVTGFHLRSHPLPPNLGSGNDTYPLELCEEVAAWVMANRSEWPGETRLGLTHDPETRAPVVWVGTTAFTASPDETRQVLASLDTFPMRGQALRSFRADSLTFEALYEIRDAAYPPGFRYAADSLFSSAPPVPTIATLAEHIVRAPSPTSHILFVLPRAPIPEAPAPGAAWSVDGDFLIDIFAGWPNGTDDAANLAWVAQAIDAFEATVWGSYMGEVDLSRWGAAKALSPEAWARLDGIRAEYDPAGGFYRPFDPIGDPEGSA
jgi:FAD/FMN-containing dehydrogenase